jgi:hypothetical protein
MVYEALQAVLGPYLRLPRKEDKIDGGRTTEEIWEIQSLTS